MRLGLMDKLFVKIHTGEKCSKCAVSLVSSRRSRVDSHLTMGVSNFLRDLFETSFAVAGATGHSLVLIDEFGIGTNEACAHGSSLAFMRYRLLLRSMGRHCWPRSSPSGRRQSKPVRMSSLPLIFMTSSSSSWSPPTHGFNAK